MVKKIETEQSIDISEIFRYLWKDKFIILLIILVCSASAFFYTNNKPKIFKFSVNLQKINPTDFKTLNFLEEEISYEDIDNFYSDFYQLLSSKRNFLNFMSQEQENLAPYLKKLKLKNTKNEDYYEKYEIETNYINLLGEKVAQINFTFDDHIQGGEIVNEYVSYTKNLFINETLIRIKSFLNLNLKEKQLEKISYEKNKKLELETNLIQLKNQLILLYLVPTQDLIILIHIVFL